MRGPAPWRFWEVYISGTMRPIDKRSLEVPGHPICVWVYETMYVCMSVWDGEYDT